MIVNLWMENSITFLLILYLFWCQRLSVCVGLLRKYSFDYYFVLILYIICKIWTGWGLQKWEISPQPNGFCRAQGSLLLCLYYVYVRIIKETELNNYFYFAVYIIKVLINSSVTAPLLRWSSHTSRYDIIVDNSSLICDERIIAEMILSWRCWEETSHEVFLLALKALNSLVKSDHCHATYNIEQLRRTDVISILFNICKVFSTECNQFNASFRSSYACLQRWCSVLYHLFIQIAITQNNVVMHCQLLLWVLG